MTLLYQSTINLAPNEGPFTRLTTLNITGIISGLISLLFIMAIILFFFSLIISGIRWVIAGGDEKAVEAAKAQITNALIGIVIVFASWAIISLVGNIFGINLLNLSIPTFVN